MPFGAYPAGARPPRRASARSEDRSAGASRGSGAPGGASATAGNTKHRRGARIWIGDRMVMVNRTREPGCIPASLHEAERTGRLLTRLCGFPVRARPVPAFVGANRIVVKAVDSSVLIAEGDSLHRTLGALPPVLTAVEIDAIAAVARDRRAWLSA